MLPRFFPCLIRNVFVQEKRCKKSAGATYERGIQKIHAKVREDEKQADINAGSRSAGEDVASKARTVGFQ